MPQIGRKNGRRTRGAGFQVHATTCAVQLLEGRGRGGGVVEARAKFNCAKSWTYGGGEGM